MPATCEVFLPHTKIVIIVCCGFAAKVFRGDNTDIHIKYRYIVKDDDGNNVKLLPPILQFTGMVVS